MSNETLQTVVVIVVLALCVGTLAFEWYHRRWEKAQAKAKHPSMRGVGMAPTIEPLPAVSVVDVPLICPICLTPFAYGHLSEFNGLIGGWIDIRKHECKQAVSA